MNDCSFSKLVFVLHWKTLFLRGFILKSTERAQVFLKKNAARDFQNSPPFERSACLLEKTTGKFERF